MGEEGRGRGKVGEEEKDVKAAIHIAIWSHTIFSHVI